MNAKKRCLVTVGGTRKYVMDKCFDERYLRRRVNGKDKQDQYYARLLKRYGHFNPLARCYGIYGFMLLPW